MAKFKHLNRSYESNKQKELQELINNYNIMISGVEDSLLIENKALKEIKSTYNDLVNAKNLEDFLPSKAPKEQLKQKATITGFVNVIRKRGVGIIKNFFYNDNLSRKYHASDIEDCIKKLAEINANLKSILENVKEKTKEKVHDSFVLTVKELEEKAKDLPKLPDVPIPPLFPAPIVPNDRIIHNDDETRYTAFITSLSLLQGKTIREIIQFRTKKLKEYKQIRKELSSKDNNHPDNQSKNDKLDKISNMYNDYVRKPIELDKQEKIKISLGEEIKIKKYDLQVFPSDICRCDDGDKITIGDLHGNALKLINILIREGVITLENGKDDYDHLVRIYYKDTREITAEDINKFNDILNKAIINSKPHLQLVGDDLSDRGSNDYFTLRIFEKLNNNQVPFDINLSNHTIEFIRAFEKNNLEPYKCYGIHPYDNREDNNAQLNDLILQGESKIYAHVTIISGEERIILSGIENENKGTIWNQDITDYFEPKTDVINVIKNNGHFTQKQQNTIISNMSECKQCMPYQVDTYPTTSLQNLGILINKGLVSKEEVNQIYSTHYQPNSKLLTYTIDAAKGECINVCSHAPIDFSVIGSLANMLKVPYDDSSLMELAKTIDRINDQYHKEYIAKNKFVSYYDQQFSPNETISELKFFPPQKTHPLAHIIWNRNEDNPEKQYTGAIFEKNKGSKKYQIRYTHGHTGHGHLPKEEYMGKIANTDNQFGKGDRTIGTYNVRLYKNRYTAILPAKTNKVEEDKFRVPTEKS